MNAPAPLPAPLPLPAPAPPASRPCCCCSACRWICRFSCDIARALHSTNRSQQAGRESDGGRESAVEATTGEAVGKTRSASRHGSGTAQRDKSRAEMVKDLATADTAYPSPGSDWSWLSCSAVPSEPRPAVLMICEAWCCAIVAAARRNRTGSARQGGTELAGAQHRARHGRTPSTPRHAAMQCADPAGTGEPRTEIVPVSSSCVVGLGSAAAPPGDDRGPLPAPRRAANLPL